MKRIRLKHIIAILSAIVLSVAVAGCKPRPGLEKYGVSLEYDAALGSVTVTNAAGEPAEKFDAGTTVTITATPKDGYALTHVVINNEEAAIVGFTHTFTIIAETTIVVTFEVAQGTGG